jgi:pentose-5-phosphate-3-epimerase
VTKILASVLGADYARLGDEVTALAETGVDAIPWQIMDGSFVPDTSFGPPWSGRIGKSRICRSKVIHGGPSHSTYPSRWSSPVAG